MPSFASAWLLLLVLQPVAASAHPGMVERFDAAVAGLSAPASPAGAEALRTKRSAADFSVERRLNIRLDFPGDVQGAMYGGLLHGEAAVFTRVGDYLDATVLRDGETEVTSFDAAGGGSFPAAPAASTDMAALAVGGAQGRVRRSVPPGHFEDPAAYNLYFHFMIHDDLSSHTTRDLHARYVAWWLADMSARVLPVEPLRASYAESVPWLTSMAYGDTDSLDAFERTLKALNDHYEFEMDRTYKHKFVLLTASSPMPGIAGVAFQGGNEAIASIAGRSRIVAHEIGHMLGATHANAETRGWWGCESNMVATATVGRKDCQEYSAANERAMRSYMRHGPDTHAPRRMADGPVAD